MCKVPETSKLHTKKGQVKKLAQAAMAVPDMAVGLREGRW